MLTRTAVLVALGAACLCSACAGDAQPSVDGDVAVADVGDGIAADASGADASDAAGDAAMAVDAGGADAGDDVVSGADAGADVGGDAMPDVAGDAADDASRDAGVDARDAAADVPGDTAVDVAGDTAADVPGDAPSDATDTTVAIDAGPDGVSDAGGGYPPGPYGLVVGDTIANLAFTSAGGSPIDLDALRADARLIVLATAASWCPTCRANAPRLDALQDTWGADGVVVVTVLYENASFLPATAADAAAWARDLALDHTVVADGPFVIAPYLAPAGREMHVVVDARDMTIARIQRSLSVSDIDAWIASVLE